MKLENKVPTPADIMKGKFKAEEQDENVPQILPISQEHEDEQVVSDTSKNDVSVIQSWDVKEEVKSERRRLSFQAMEESTESEPTPSPSPKVQRRKLEVSNVSSSSEDIKTESTDSNMEDEDFIRRQIMGMGDEEEMSISDDEKERKLTNEEALKDVELENTTVTLKGLSRKGSVDKDDSPVTPKALPKATTETTPAPPSTTFKKAIPVMRQRQSTDEEVESITDTLSKGSSSIQASSFTPESSPTSASSLEEDSDSSPSHRKIRGDKHHRRGKHRQPTQPLPTIEDSSEDEKRREEKSKKDKDQAWAHGEKQFPTEELSSTEDLRQATVIEDTSRTSGSEYSASIESEQEARQAVQRGRKPSTTVIPYIPSAPFDERDIVTKPLKSAEEAYEEIIQKTKAIPGESPPDIEPLYGGMAIEDYLYESLVEEPEIKISVAKEEELEQDIGSESLKKLRTPEEVYEEMMQKKRELIMIEQEFQLAQTAMESSPVGVSPFVVDTCVVAMPTEDISIPAETITPHGDTETPTEVPVKKKKRPAPPRPTEPPKRTEVTFVPSTATRSIGFVRPMIPQDPALRKDLNIPDLKITQCSSGEEEDDSLAEEYGVGISSDITPSDDSETKEDPSLSPPLSETAEMEPICVVCEIPEPKPIPTPISAPELTTTPSPVSPVSPPTSPATPNSSLDSNATSSSSFQAQTPLSPESTPMSTPTPPPLFVTQSPLGISSPSPPTTVVLPSGPQVSRPTATTVVVTIPDVVSDQAKDQTITIDRVKASPATTSAQVVMSTAVPVVVQMPDLVSSPSQMPIEAPAVIQVSAPSPASAVASAQSTAQVVDVHVPGLSSTASAPYVSASDASSSSPGPAIVQMPDLVSTTSPISVQTPLPVSALVTTPAQAQAKVVHSVPVRPAIPYISPGAVPTPAQTAHAPAPVLASTTIIKKKIPPPPPPRSTSVTLPESNTGLSTVRTSQHVTPALTTTAASEATLAAKPMQSVVVDIQPRMEEMHPDDVAVPQIVTPTRQGHVVIIVPSVENLCRRGQNTQDIASSGPTVSTPAMPQNTEKVTHQSSNVPSTDTASLATKVSAVPPATASPLPPKPMAGTVEIPVAETPPPPSTTTAKPALHPKPQVSTTSTMPSAAPVTTTAASGQTTKPPPPIPPKPISIPAGLVFSHKPGESVKPPPLVAPKAATLPRTKEPPNALSLSLTRPVESKLGTTSPKSPLSPRHSKCLQTYVVITLPSELGSPPDGITVQAPLRRGSVPSTKVSDIRSTPTEQRAEAFSAQATVRRASVTTVRHTPSIPTPPTVTGEQVKPSEVAPTDVQRRRDSVPSVLQTPPPLADVNKVSSGQDELIEVHSVPTPIKKQYIQQQQQQITQSLPPFKAASQIVTLPTETQILIQPQGKEDHDVMHPQMTTEVTTALSVVSSENLVPQSQIPTIPTLESQSVTNVAKSLQPEGPLEVLFLHDQSNAVTSADIYPQTESQTGVLQREDAKTDYAIVPEAAMITSQIPEINQQTFVPQQPVVAKDFKNTYTIVEVPLVPEPVQPTTILPFMVGELSMQQPHLVADVNLPTSYKESTEVIQTDSAFRINQVEKVTPVVQPLSGVTDVSQTIDFAKVIQPTSVDKVTTSSTDDLTPSPLAMEVQQITVQPVLPHVTEIPQVYGAGGSSVMSYSTPPLEVIAFQPEHESSTEIVTKDIDMRNASVASSVIKPQAVTGMPVEIITTEETTSRRRTSISSIVQPSYITNENFTYPTEYVAPAQVAATQSFATTRRESITMQQPLHLAQVLSMPAERDVPMDGHAVQVHYRTDSISSSEPLEPLEVITTEAYTRRTSMPNAPDIPQGMPVAPVTITKIQQESIESQEIRGPEKVVSSMSHMYSSSISASGQPPVSLPSLVTQVVTTEVQRTTVSVVHERFPQVPPPSVAITIQPDVAKSQPLPKKNGKIIYPSDVIDLRTVKPGIKMTEQGMDLTPPESSRQSFSSDSSGRQITAVQPEIVNLSAEITPAPTLSVVTDNITIVTCTATIASYNNTPAERPLDLQGPVASLPMPLTAYKPFEPLAQIIYRPVNSQAVVSDVASTAQDIPINLSYGMSSAGKESLTSAPAAISNGGPIISLEATGAMDLSNYRPVRAMVALSGTSPGVVTTVVEDDGTPVDLTAGRRSVCCDVIYKLPFTGSCRTQPPVTTQPDNYFGYKDDKSGNAGLYGVKGMNGIKVSMSETGLTEAGLFSYDSKNDQDYLSGPSDGAIDLTAAKLSAGEYEHISACSFYLACWFVALLIDPLNTLKVPTFVTVE